MCHEAIPISAICPSFLGTDTHFVILSSILLGSRMKVGSTTRLKSAPGRSWLIICDKTRRSQHQSLFFVLEKYILTISLVRLHDRRLVLRPIRLRFIVRGPIAYPSAINTPPLTTCKPPFYVSYERRNCSEDGGNTYWPRKSGDAHASPPSFRSSIVPFPLL
jgi:hypothetical protein